MPIGPFDRRKKRSRCHSCSTRHLKCSGDNPCSNCHRKGLRCEYPSSLLSRGVILLDQGSKSASSGSPSSTGAPSSNKQLQVSRSPTPDFSSCYFYYFDVFIHKNKFTTQSNSQNDIKRLIHQSPSGRYLIDAMLSLGAMGALKLRAPDAFSDTETRSFAFNSYSSSIVGLRSALVAEITEPHVRQTVLWTTHLLGLFELMSDATGYGWIQHIVHGTSKALVASGSNACRSGLGKSFFMEAKIFEVCRSIIFNEPTFLTRSDWMALSLDLRRQDIDADWKHLDALLDIVAECSALRVRASTFIKALGESVDDETLVQANSIASEGFRLRTFLFSWFTAGLGLRSNSPVISASDNTEALSSSTSEGFMLLAQVIFAATSIYLSGVFDYEIIHWQKLDIMVSTLSENDIQDHVKTILQLSDFLITKSDVSPILLLFPLRVAGARSFDDWQQDWIIRLLEKIEVTFSAAAAFKMELRKVWDKRKFITIAAKLDDMC